MKRIFILSVIIVMVMGFSLQAHAALQNLGADSLGNRLIYDTDLNITWYDYTRASDTWQGQVNWASALTVNFGSNVYNDWRLPLTEADTFTYGYDGTTTAGYNITSSEMGHLFYAELGNKGFYATDGTHPQPGWGLTNTGDFQNLQPNAYWSGTGDAVNTKYAWYFRSHQGYQIHAPKASGKYALAVRPGLAVAVAPEPMSMVLFGVGGAVLAVRRKLLKQRDERK